MVVQPSLGFLAHEQEVGPKVVPDGFDFGLVGLFLNAAIHACVRIFHDLNVLWA